MYKALSDFKCTKHCSFTVTLSDFKQETDDAVREHFFGFQDGVRPSKDRSDCVSVALLLKVVMLASSV